MHQFMEYIVRCYDVLNKWDEDNLYPALIATPRAVLDFQIPTAASFTVGKKSTPHFGNSLKISNNGIMNGSLSYLYSSVALSNVLPSSTLSLQDALSTYRYLDSLSKNKSQNTNGGGAAAACNNVLMYGTMNFPSNSLMVLMVKNFSSTSRVLVKALSTNNGLSKNQSIFTMYFQQNYAKSSREFIYSSNESLVGFRHAYNFDLGSSNDASTESSAKTEDLEDKVFYDNSKFSVGAEYWYGIGNMTPGMSHSMRYSTYSTYTGKPLTITLSCSPLMGLLTATYTVKTSLNSTLCSRYDFNMFSYESNLTLGCELWNSAGRLGHEVRKFEDVEQINREFSRILEKNEASPKFSNIERFKYIYKNLTFSSVLRMATSMNEKDLKLLWECKFKDFLVEVGGHVDAYGRKHKVGIAVQVTS